MALSMIPANENGIDSDSSRYVTVNGGHNRDVSFCQLLIAKIPQSEMKVGNIGIMRNLRRNWTRGSISITRAKSHVVLRAARKVI